MPLALDFLPCKDCWQVNMAIFSIKLPKIVSSPEDTVASIIERIRSPAFSVVTPIDLLMVKFTFYKRSNNLIVHLFAFRKTNGFSY
ncbi:hypothetical protein Q8W15_16720 [Photobacterium damselae subsp. piscicida]|nr:hypothetical protein [Photobacterium damselae]MDP2534181.1 hypothetical protein [Photobacterium damselae subsp. piscicida]MDP2558480.1 hypothetical protein [Photobacterium damselae subsp. piscicida]MDP2568526.1 hypothetical protein [Photobacterium damselae subsp. piscicida]MDP2568540.1 hypothetical protein [Photobacterium damselae subsp. piscicida]GAW47675.1 hypothetical protein PDPJ_7_00017 [Photobacterium damselae subsp. piscicida]